MVQSLLFIMDIKISSNDPDRFSSINFLGILHVCYHMWGILKGNVFHLQFFVNGMIYRFVPQSLAVYVIQFLSLNYDHYI